VSLLATVFHANEIMNVLSAIWKSLFELLEERLPFIYYGVSRVSSMLLCSAESRPSGLKKLRYNPLCDADEESSSDMLSEELN
jgi:hypothetical protein